MKNQYFGDTRDLFKYDFIQFLLSYLCKVKNVLFVSMLTPDDDTFEGQKTKYNNVKAGYYNKELIFWLKKSIQEFRNINQIFYYFERIGYQINILNEIFYNDSRSRYFNIVVKSIKPNSLIFIDPDNGLEVNNSNEKHLLFSELNFIYRRLDKNSIVLIYQHIPRENRKNYVSRRLNEIKDKVVENVLYISDNEIVFFLICKSKRYYKKLNKIVQQYYLKYPKITIVDAEKINPQKKLLDL